MSGFTLYPGTPGEDYRHGNVLFVVSVLLLWGLGIFTLLVCTPDTAQRLFNDRYYFVVRQLVWSAVGAVFLVGMALLPLRVLRKYLPYFVMGTLILCILTCIPGIRDERKGAYRWISIPHVATIQPSEFAKFAVVLFLANLFNKNLREYEANQKNFLYPLIGLFIFVIIVFLQKDFSTGVFIFVVGCVMFFVTGARMTWLGPLVLLAVPAAALMIAIEPYRLMRVVAFFRPEEFTLTSGYQQFASQRAIISGGFWGNGFGTGLEKVNSIPEVQTDYIFAGWSCAMGLFGVSLYIVLLLFFAWRGYVIALHTPNRFAGYAAFGCTTMIFLQSLVNIGVVCGALPTTGIPQPFFSSGGSSLVVSMAMCGFIINASHCDEDDDGTDFAPGGRNG